MVLDMINFVFYKLWMLGVLLSLLLMTHSCCMQVIVTIHNAMQKNAVWDKPSEILVAFLIIYPGTISRIYIYMKNIISPLEIILLLIDQSYFLFHQPDLFMQKYL